ncbi:MAG: sterol desaturase family protein [Ignavibacteriae bacterium]|nr:sterol desaturase family protein [Ignavibacteriota bacterium]
MAKRYVSNKDESARLFKSDFLEIFTHVHPTIPLIVYVPLIVYLLYLSVDASLGVAEIMGLFLAGVLTWTLTEYLLHRFVFHYEPTSNWGKQLHFLMHGVHHDYPNDSLRLVMPPVISLPLALTFYLLFYWLIGERATWAFFPGFIFGYLCYDMIHYATHHFSMKGPIRIWVKQHHMRHHYQTDDYNYGVSSPLWDFVFGTYQPKREAATQE